MPPRPFHMEDPGTIVVTTVPTAGSPVAPAFIFNGVGLRYPVAKITSASHGAVELLVATPASTAYMP